MQSIKQEHSCKILYSSIYEPHHEKICFFLYMNNKGTNQTVHLRLRCLDSIISLDSIEEISTGSLASAAVQAGLCLTRSGAQKTRFLDEEERFGCIILTMLLLLCSCNSVSLPILYGGIGWSEVWLWHLLFILTYYVVLFCVSVLFFFLYLFICWPGPEVIKLFHAQLN